MRATIAATGDWLVDLSRLPDLPGRRPVRSELTHLLVQSDRVGEQEQCAVLSTNSAQVLGGGLDLELAHLAFKNDH